MLEKISKEIKTLNKILETLKNLEENEEIERELKENKYLKEITKNYFEENILKTIIENKNLIAELKENHIKLTEKQKETEQKHKKYITEIETIIKNILRILEKLEEQTTYIDNEIISILKLNEIEDLKQIIEFNKQVNLKKKGMLEEKQESVRELKQKNIEENNNENNQTIKPEIPKQKKKKPEKILIFKNIEEINEYLEKNYNIKIETDKNLEELNDILEIIENEPFEIKEGEKIKEILETSSLKRIKDLKKILKSTNSSFDMIKNIENILKEEIIQDLIITAVLYDKTSTKEEKEIILNKNYERRKAFLKNKIIVTLNAIPEMPIITLLKPLSLEKIEQIIEIGHAKSLIAMEKAYKKFDELKKIQFEDFLEKEHYKNMYTFFFGTMIYNEKYIIKEGTNDTEELEKRIYKNMKIKTIIPNQKINLEQYTSKNPILKKEEETNKKSQIEFHKTMIPYWKKKENPIYNENNPYFELIEKKYGKNLLPQYQIPIKSELSKLKYVFISKNKVIRLLNQHILDNDEITKEIVKQCMYFNLITTEEILEELDKILTADFEKINKKQKSIK